MFQRQAAFDKVQMRIVEAWQYGRSLRIDHHRLGALQPDDLGPQMLVDNGGLGPATGEQRCGSLKPEPSPTTRPDMLDR